jgi:hypothetical protein
MQFFEQLKDSFSSLYQDRKKTVIAACILVILAIGGIFAGIFLPTNSKTNSSLSNAEPTKVPSDGRSPEVIAYYTDTPPTPTPTPVLSNEEKLALFGSPTPTPLPGVFYIPNGKQNDLEIRYFLRHEGDSFDEVKIMNKKTTEERIIGYMYHYTPGDNAVFSKDFSQVLYVGGQSKEDYNKISFYSIASKRVVKEITLTDMKKKLPSLTIDPLSNLSVLAISPDKNKLAVSYGNTFRINQIDPASNIIVINIKTNTMALLPVYGLVKAWKDDNTLQYEINTTDPNVNNTLEVQIPSL